MAARRSMKVGAEMIPMATNGNSGAGVAAQEKFDMVRRHVTTPDSPL